MGLIMSTRKNIPHSKLVNLCTSSKLMHLFNKEVHDGRSIDRQKYCTCFNIATNMRLALLMFKLKIIRNMDTRTRPAYWMAE